MKKDYLAWYHENKDFFDHLEHHDMILFYTLNDVVDVMNVLVQYEEKEMQDYIAVFFESGFSYLFHSVGQIKIYLEKYFDNDFHELLHYEAIINYALYLEDLKDTIRNQDDLSEALSQEIGEIEEFIEEILENKPDEIEEILDELDARLQSIIPSKKEYLTVPEIFSQISEILVKK